MSYGREYTPEELELAERYPWIDPIKRRGRTFGETELLDGLTKVKRYLAVRTYATHKSVEIFRPCHSVDFEHVDGHDWELFSVCYTGAVDGVGYVWGSYVEGLGAFHVMVPLEFTRELTEAERTAWSGRGMQMVGSHTGKLSYTFSLPEL